MTLTEFLKYFDFNYRLYDNGENIAIGLIDLTQTNLADIESERYYATSTGILSLLDRLNNYYKDYIFKELEEKINNKGLIPADTWEGLWQQAIVYKIDFYGKELMPYIFGEQELVKDFTEKEKIKEENEDY